MDEDDAPEIEISIEPIAEELERLGVTEGEFEQALSLALDDHHDRIDEADEPDEVPGLGEVLLVLKGKTVTLGEVAEIRIVGGLD